MSCFRFPGRRPPGTGGGGNNLPHPERHGPRAAVAAWNYQPAAAPRTARTASCRRVPGALLLRLW